MDERHDMSSGRDKAVTPALGRLAGYVYLADLAEGRRVLEVGCGDGRGAEFLASRGARRVISVDPSASAIEAARRAAGGPAIEYRHESLTGLGLETASVECIFVPEGESVLGSSEALGELRRVLREDGQLVVQTANADRPGATGGASFHAIIDALEPLFSPVRMIAQAPFVALSLVEYAGAQDAEVERAGAGGPGPEIEPDVELDASLRELDDAAEGAPDATGYIALCGAPAARARPFAIVQVPTDPGLSWAAEARGGRELRGRPEEVARGEDDREALARARAEAERAREARARSEAELERLRTELERRETEAARSDQVWDDKLARERERAEGLASEVERLEAQLKAHDETPAAAGDAAARAGLAGEDLAATTPAEPTISERIAEAMVRHADRVRDLETAIEERQALADELADELERASARSKAYEARSRRAEDRVRELEELLGRFRTRAAIAEGALLGQRPHGERVENGAAQDPGPAQAAGETPPRAGAKDRDGGAERAAERSSEHDIAGAQACLTRAAERLYDLERKLRAESSIVGELESGLREIHTALAQGESADRAGGEASQLATFSRELGKKDAELAVLHVGLSALRQRLREVVGHVRDARQEMQGRPATEMVAVMDRLSTRLEAYEEMAAEATGAAGQRAGTDGTLGGQS